MLRRSSEILRIPAKDEGRKLLVGGLSRNTTDRELMDHFGKFGEIESITVKIDAYTGVSRGFAFIVFTNPKTIDKLLASGEHYINKRKVDIIRVSKEPRYRKVLVGGLTPEITDDDIKSYFGQYGRIVELKNQRKGICFITFDSEEVVYKLLKTPKQTINGKEVDVMKVKVNPDERNQGYWGPGYGYGYMGYGAQGEPRGNGHFRKLFVGGLSRNTTDRELMDHFGKFGEIESITVKIDAYTGVSRGFAFIVFTNPKTIDKLLASGEHYINKRKVDIKRVSKEPRYGKVLVGGLTPEITDDDIKSYFGQYGRIVELKNQRKGICFITFDSEEVVYKLLKTPKQTINGKEVDVMKVKVNPDERNQGYWGPGYGYGYMGYGAQGKPRGNGQGPRQFQRHQPY